MSPKNNDRVRVLHVSDLHAHPSAQGGDADDRRSVLGDAWTNNLDEIQHDGPIDLVCFTGDVAQSGRAPDYQSAAPFVQALMHTLHLDMDRFFAVPGNHDVDRGVAPQAWRSVRNALLARDAGSAPEAPDPHDLLVRRQEHDAVLPRGGAFRQWLHDLGRDRLLGGAGALGFRSSMKLPDRPAPVHVIGLDSAWMCGDDEDQGKLLLTEDQVLRRASLQGLPLSGLRIALMHHPLDWLMQTDQRRCSALLSRYVDILLHGHVHAQSVRRESSLLESNKDLQVAAAGSLFEGKHGSKWINGFQVIDVRLDPRGRPCEYRYSFRRWSGSSGRWTNGTSLREGAHDGRLIVHVRRSEGASPQGDPEEQRLRTLVKRTFFPDERDERDEHGERDKRDEHGEEERRVEKVMRRILSHNHKLGLLVDDAEDAETRVARELYGSEDLPPWWVVARSLACARRALRAFHACFVDASKGEQGVIVVDRYLPLICGGGRPVPWDAMAGRKLVGDEEEHRKALREAASVRDLIEELERSAVAADDMGAAGGYVMKFVTSYERTGGDELDSSKWSPRRVEPMRALRRALVAARSDALLRRGPEQDEGQAVLKYVANALNDRNEHVALLTGWGVSEGRGAHGPGFPWLSDEETAIEARLRALGERIDPWVLDQHDTQWARPERRFAHRCIHKRDGDAAQRGTSGLRSIFEKVRARKDLRDAFGRMLLRHDHGYAYHHWLLARMPWRAILTMTCDGFHERSGLAASLLPGLERDIQQRTSRLGTPVPWGVSENDQKSHEARWDNDGVGRLYRVEDWPNTDRAVRESVQPRKRSDPHQRGQRRNRDERLQRALETVFYTPDRNTLVVLGVERDELKWIREDPAIKSLRVQIVWVSSMPTSRPPPPKDVRALSRDVADFVYDLWRLLQSG